MASGERSEPGTELALEAAAGADAAFAAADEAAVGAGWVSCAKEEGAIGAFVNT